MANFMNLHGPRKGKEKRSVNRLPIKEMSSKSLNLKIRKKQLFKKNRHQLIKSKTKL